MKNYLLIITLCLSLKGFSQEKPLYPDSTKKGYFSIMLNCPTTRGATLIGAERFQKINEGLAFTFSLFIGINPFSYFVQKSGIDVKFCIQPFHLIIGKKPLKFETGLSITETGLSITAANFNYKTYFYNLYFGARYTFKKVPLHVHVAYIPNVSQLNDSKTGYINFVGYELGIGYILHKSKSSK